MDAGRCPARSIGAGTGGIFSAPRKSAAKHRRTRRRNTDGGNAIGRAGEVKIFTAFKAPAIKRPSAPEKPARKKIREPDFLPVEEYELPPVTLLQLPAQIKNAEQDEATLQANAQMLTSVLADFGIGGEIVRVSPGPVVTLYELEPAPGIKSSRVIGLADDIARSLSAVSVRVAVVPGKNVIGIELPNARRETSICAPCLAPRIRARRQ